MQEPTETRRERKKRAAREAIAATARQLFAERGFDAVPVAEIAAAADVAEKTVFNHFPTKDDLVFPGRREQLDRLVAAIAERPAGTGVVDVFRAATAALIDDLVAADGDPTPAIIEGSRALQERLNAGWEDEAAAITAAVANASGAPAGDVVPAVVARTLSWTHRAIHRATLAGLLAGEDRKKLARRMRAEARRAYDQLAGGLGGYGRA